MKAIVLLTEDASNEAVKTVAQAITQQCQKSNILLRPLIVEKKTGDGLILDRNVLIRESPGLFSGVVISLDDIAFVMVRTWTEKREPVVALANELKARGICIADLDALGIKYAESFVGDDYTQFSSQIADYCIREALNAGPIRTMNQAL